MSVFMFFCGIPSIDAFVCALPLIMSMLACAMCINACPLLSAFVYGLQLRAWYFNFFARVIIYIFSISLLVIVSWVYNNI